jgi:sporulation protein YqfC
MTVKKNKKNRISLKELLTAATDIPKEVALNLPRISIIGNSDVHIENVKGVIEYTETLIKLNTSIGVIKFTGSNFKIMDITTEDMYIEGKIKSIEIMQ